MLAIDLSDPADLLGFVADLVKQADGDAFALLLCWRRARKGCRTSTVPSWPWHSCFPARLTPLRRLSAGFWTRRRVRRALANALGDAARKGKVTPTMLRRMITMRNWLPEDSRPALDAAIATARRKGVSPAQWDDVEVRQLMSTGVDGSGAIGVLAHCRNKRKNVLGSLVLKHGFGVRDAWAREGMTPKEIDQTFFEAGLMDQFTSLSGLYPMCGRPFPGASGIRPARCRRSVWCSSLKPSVSLRFSLNL